MQRAFAILRSNQTLRLHGENSQIMPLFLFALA